MKSSQFLILLFLLYSSCSTYDRSCNGVDRVVINQELLSDISMNVGEVFTYDLFAEPEIFYHPNELEFDLNIKSNIGFSATIGILNGILTIRALEAGSFYIQLFPVDECNLDNDYSKNISLTISDR